MSNTTKKYFRLKFHTSRSFPLMARIEAPNVDKGWLTINNLEKDDFIEAVDQMIQELEEIKKEAIEGFQNE